MRISHLGGGLYQDVKERWFSMCRAVDEIAIMATVGDSKQEVVGHGLVGSVAFVLDVAGVDVCLREGPRHPASCDQQFAVPRRFHHDVGEVVWRSTYTTRGSAFNRVEWV